MKKFLTFVAISTLVAATAFSDPIALTRDTTLVDPAYLSFDYKMSHSIFGKPVWLPRRVYDDGKNTYIFLDDRVVHSISPILLNKKNERINYRVSGTLITIDSLIEKVTVSDGRDRVVIEKEKGAPTAFSNPIGLTFGIDGFSFGNVTGKDYKFAGEGGQASITPQIEFDHAFGKFGIYARVSDTIGLTDPSIQTLTILPKISLYALPAFSLWTYLNIGIEIIDGKTNTPPATAEIAFGLKYSIFFKGGGSLYALAEIGFATGGKYTYIETTPGGGTTTKNGTIFKTLTGSEDGFKIGLENVTVGKGTLYGYVQPVFIFSEKWGDKKNDAIDAFQALNIRAGYSIGPVDLRATLGIPLFKDGVKTEGLTATPRVTYSIGNAAKVYIDLGIGNLGADNGADVSIVPSIGCSYTL